MGTSTVTEVCAYYTYNKPYRFKNTTHLLKGLNVLQIPKHFNNIDLIF